MAGNDKIEFHWWYNYDKFENEVVPKVEKFVKSHKDQEHGHFVFDLSNTTSGDLMELACLLVAADHIHLETGCNCIFKFVVPDEVKAGLRSLEQMMQRPNLPKNKKDFLFELLAEEKQFFDKRMRFASYLADRLAFFSLLSEKNYRTNISDCNVYRKQTMLFPELSAVGTSLWLRLTLFRNPEDLVGEGGILERLKSEILWRLPYSEKQRNSFSNGIITALCENVLSHAYGDGQEPDCAITGVRQLRPPKTHKERDARLGAPDWLADFFKFYLEENLTEVTVVDGGQGIYESLGSTYREAKGCKGSELEVLEWSFEPGTSRFRHGRNSAVVNPGPEVGWGLWELKSYVNAWGGLVYVRTGHTRVVYFPEKLKRKPHMEPNLKRFPGTQYRIILPHIECIERIQQVEENKEMLMRSNLNE